MYLNIKMISLKIQGVDHVGFNVADVERSVSFYTDKLGLPPERLEAFRDGKVPFPSVRINAGTILDLFPPEYHGAQPGGNNVNHIALTFDNAPAEIEAFLKDRGVAIAREMTGNFGARGDTAHSFHVYDPDGNMLELQSYESD
jgi:catechol 2,3-dioxygenase-like lactoylglutathione lyase family enzyme